MYTCNQHRQSGLQHCGETHLDQQNTTASAVHAIALQEDGRRKITPCNEALPTYLYKYLACRYTSSQKRSITSSRPAGAPNPSATNFLMSHKSYMHPYLRHPLRRRRSERQPHR